MPINVAIVENRVFAAKEVKLRFSRVDMSMQIDMHITRTLLAGAGRC